MIGAIAKLVGGSSVAAWLIVGVLSLGLAGGVYWYVDHGGYSRATLEWTVKYEQRELALERQRLAELDRQAMANDTAKASEAARLAQLRSELADLEIQLKERANEAAADPDRDAVSCNLDCVRRHNSIGGAG